MQHRVRYAAPVRMPLTRRIERVRRRRNQKSPIAAFVEDPSPMPGLVMGTALSLPLWLAIGFLVQHLV